MQLLKWGLEPHFIDGTIKKNRGRGKMTKAQFHRAAPKMTVCEKLREINDLHQGSSKHDVVVRQLLFDAQVMAKKMSGKLLDYNVDAFKDFWDKNPNYLKNFRKRIDGDYLGGGGNEVKEKELKLFASKINSRERHGKYIADDLISLPFVLGHNKCIVEIGAWMGQVTAYLALGIKKSHRYDLELHCFDQWKATEQICEEIKNHKNIRLKPGEDLLPAFEANTAPFGVEIHAHKGKPANALWDGRKISLFVFNPGTLKKDAKRILKTFSPYFIKRRTLILWMDYYYGEDKSLTSWRKEIYSKSDSLQFIRRIEKSKAAIFKYRGGRIVYD